MLNVTIYYFYLFTLAYIYMLLLSITSLRCTQRAKYWPGDAVGGGKQDAVLCDHKCKPNSDGIDLDCVTNAVVENSYFDVGDDALCVKSGLDWFGRKWAHPSRNILFRNIVVGHGHGISIGSEMSGGVNNVTFENIAMTGTQRGPRIKSQRGRGGVVQDIVFRNVSAQNVSVGLSFSLEYSSSIPPTNASATPIFRNIFLEDISFTGSGSRAEFIGLSESPIENVTLKRVTFSAESKFGLCKHVAASTCIDSSACPPCFSGK